MNRLPKITKGWGWRWLARLVRKRGMVLMPIWEIERMEYEAQCAYAAMSKPDQSPQDKGYFNGLGDCGSKTASQLRQRYLPNT